MARRRRRQENTPCATWIILLAPALAGLIYLAVIMGTQSLPTEGTNPSASFSLHTAEPTPEPSGCSQPSETTIPMEPSSPSETVPPTTRDPNLTGSVYTRQELEAMDNTSRPYGPGATSDGNRPPYADPTQQRYEQYGANFIAPDDGNIYLTFDCGYEFTATDENGNKYRVTEKILDVLKEKNVKAVFFVTMSYCQKSPDLVQRMIAEGHAVGNHTNNHPVMPNISIDEMVYEVMSLHEYVLDHFGYEMNLFRFPTGRYSVRSLAVVQSLGYESVHWSFAYADYTTSKQPSLEYAYERVTGYHHSGAIYLLHAVSVTNASILGDAIDFFRAQGYNLALFTP